MSIRTTIALGLHRATGHLAVLVIGLLTAAREFAYNAVGEEEDAAVERAEQQERKALQRLRDAESALEAADYALSDAADNTALVIEEAQATRDSRHDEIRAVPSF